MDKNEIYNILVKNIPAEQIKLEESMKNHVNFKIGGNAQVYVIAKDVKQIQEVQKISKQNDIPLTILGNGSNLLVSDKGINGIVLKIALDKFEIEKQENKALITVGSGVPLGKIAYMLVKEEIAGFEFAGGIPGTLGGAIYMNAGAYGGEMKDCIKTVTCINSDGEIKKLTNSDCEFEYRHSIFMNKKFIILEADIELPYGNKEEIDAKMQEYAESRKAKQPLELPSAGSTFKRGIDFITAKVIDECGLKGYTIGGAQVSTLHAGFVVNIGNATANDVLSVIEHVKQTVLEQTGKKIELEIELIGEF